MSTQEFFAARLARELPAFNRVVRAMPNDRLDYRPHEKNTPAGQLAWQVSSEFAQLVELFEKGEVHHEPSDTPATIDEIASTLERNGEAALAAVKSLSEERWNGPGRFFVREKVVWEDKISEMAWGYLLDLIHHRGQLTAYLRPMGGKVPAVYGPTADDKG
jgi:uncharacterized damage-inducible protein DinB